MAGAAAAGFYGDAFAGHAALIILGKEGIKQPAAFWAISGGSGFMVRVADAG
jgi:hypothetical protein